MAFKRACWDRRTNTTSLSVTSLHSLCLSLTLAVCRLLFAVTMTAAANIAKFPQFLLVAFLCLLHEGSSFSPSTCSQRRIHQEHHHHHQQQQLQQQQRRRHQSRHVSPSRSNEHQHENIVTYICGRPDKLLSNKSQQQQYRRRNVLSAVAAAFATFSAVTTSIPLSLFFANKANAAVGTLPEFSNTNAILQSITIDVISKSQLDETVAFFTGGAFEGMKLLRERNNVAAGASSGGDDINGMVQEAWLGFGPETLSIPSTFTLPVSSFSQYGGHASIHVRYDPQQQNKTSSPQYYQRSDGEYNNALPTGDNIAYLQLGVPAYRISQMVKNYGNILDAYGWVNVISPAGLPIRAIVGIRPDPIMFLAVNCVDVKKSEEFYYEQLGFVRQVS